MPDFIGNIEVPEEAASGTFPLVTQAGWSYSVERPVSVFAFGSANAKIEQRFKLGDGLVRHRFVRDVGSPADVKAVWDFWRSHEGSKIPFTMNVPGDSLGDALTAKTVRFEDGSLRIPQSGRGGRVELTVREEPTSTPSYAVTSTVERFPSTALENALLEQAQELIPLQRIIPGDGSPAAYLSDRRVIVDSQLYVPRLLEPGDITQSINGEADLGVFRYGNADRAMRDYIADVTFRHARVEDLFYHVASQTLVEFWAGYVTSWEGGTGAEITVRCGDRISALGLRAPRRSISRRCWKPLDNGKHCPATAQGGTNLGTPCDKLKTSAAGCDHHNMSNYFGGMPIDVERAHIKFSNTGLFAGIGRKTLATTSTLVDSAFEGDRALPVVYTDLDMAVEATILAGREENDFYVALGVVSEGPIGAFGDGHRLDGQPHHGFGTGNPTFGLRTSLGPTPDTEHFGLADTGPGRSAGVAFVAIRRNDPPGRDLSQAADHRMTAVVAQGKRGYTWSGGTRSGLTTLTDPAWVAIDQYLSVLRADLDSAAEQEALFDVSAAEAVSAINNTIVNKIVGTGTTKQWVFRGVIDQRKSLRDWLTEILGNALAGYTWRNGKLRLFSRSDSAAVEAFTAGNIVFGSLAEGQHQSAYNRLTVEFGERRTGAVGEPPSTVGNSVIAEDEDAAIEESGSSEPAYRDATVRLAGTDSRDQAARLGTTLVREQSGGTTAAERKAARPLSWLTTILALAVEPGQVVSVTHDDVVGGVAEQRVQRWRRRPDWGVEIAGKASTDSMYDLLTGSTSIDVEPDPLPDEQEPSLDAPDVTNLTASEDPKIQPDGTVVSEVTISYDEQAGTSSYLGGGVYLRNRDSAGDPAEDWHFHTDIQKNASPDARRFCVPTTGNLLDIAVVSYSAFSRNQLVEGVTPQTQVLLDGKQSAPTPPANLSCRQIDRGFEISGENGPESDFARAVVAYTFDLTPYAVSAIKAEQVIGEAAVGKELDAASPAQERWTYTYQSPRYRGSSDGTTVTLDDANVLKPGQLMVETAAGVFTGANARFFHADGVAEDERAVSNTAGTITFPASSIPSGRVEFDLVGVAGEANFYAAHEDRTGNRSAMTVVPPCTVLDRFGTADVDRPAVNANQLTGGAWFRTGRPGTPGRGEVTALPAAVGFGVDRLNVNGINGWRVRLTLEDPPGGSSGAEVFEFSQSIGSGTIFEPVAGTWVRQGELLTIRRPNVEITQVELAAHNAHGWGAYVAIQYLTSLAGPYLTGAPVESRVAAVAYSATPAFDLGQYGTNWFEIELTGNVTSLTVPGAQNGAEVTLEFVQDATGGRTVAFPAAWKGLEGFTVDTRANKRTIVRVKFKDATNAVLAGVPLKGIAV